MSHRSHVQLIDKIELPSSVLLNLWDLEERVQLSIEIGNPAGKYLVGEVFTLDRTAKTAKLALERSAEKVDAKALLIPRKTVAKTGPYLPRVVIRTFSPKRTGTDVFATKSFWPIDPTVSASGKKKQGGYKLIQAKLRARLFARAKAAKVKKAESATLRATKQTTFSGTIIK